MHMGDIQLSPMQRRGGTKIKRSLKPRDTVLERKNLKHLELLVNNDGKKIKIILTFLS